MTTDELTAAVPAVAEPGAGDPITRFLREFERAAEAELFDHTAAILATSGASNRPSARVVLVKHVDQEGFVFYTNRDSRKGSDLAANPFASVCFHWPTLDEQIRIEGRVEQISDSESDAYFASRPRGSQLGAWASLQSRVMQNAYDVVTRYVAQKLKYTGRNVPRPPNWGGYRVIPDRMEFWYRGKFRLHTRVLYISENNEWREERLYP